MSEAITPSEKRTIMMTAQYVYDRKTVSKLRIFISSQRRYFSRGQKWRAGCYSKPFASFNSDFKLFHVTLEGPLAHELFKDFKRKPL